jgi:hypothetical protein
MKNKTMKKVHLFLFLILAFGISCSSNGDDPKPDDPVFDGSFDVKITGELNKSLKGSAGFTHAILTSKDKFENGSTLSLALTTDAEEDIITILVGELGNLGGIKVGTYTVDLEPEEGDPVALVGIVTNKSFAYIGSSGEVKITKVEKTKVSGSMSVTLMDADEKTITITGTFEAIGTTTEL